MSYAGPTVPIQCSRGGLVMGFNEDAMQPYDMVEGTKNINLANNGREPRGGTSHVNTTAVTGTPALVRLMDYLLSNGNRFLLMYDGNGVLWKNYTESIASLTAGVWPDYEILDDTFYMVNGSDTPQTWDGDAATTSDMTLIPTDWSGTNQPSWIIAQNRGSARRLIAGGCPDNPGIIYVSDNISVGDTPDFSDACVSTYNVDTGDGYGAVGAAKLGEYVVVFGKNKAFIFDDSSVDDALWGFKTAPWSGGAAHQRLIVKTPNDIIVMTEQGDLVSVVAVQEANDYKQASLARPAFFDAWMRAKLSLNQIDKFHMLYDVSLRALRLFVVRKGKQAVDTCLKYYIDRPPNEAWMLDDNLSYASGFNAASSVVVDTKVHTGDYSGFVWELESPTYADNGNGYYAGFKTSRMTAEDPRYDVQWTRGIIVGMAQGNKNITVKPRLDDLTLTTKTVTMHGNEVLWNESLWNAFTWSSKKGIINKQFSLGANGIRLQCEFYNETVNEGFFISQVLFDYKKIGKGANDGN